MRNDKADFSNPECGATSVEYALVLTLIAVAIITALSVIGGNLKQRFESSQQPPTVEQSATP